MDKLTKERIEQIIANIDSDEARGATQSYVSYKVLRELCELALQGMGGEAVAWRLVDKNGKPVKWAELQRGDTHKSLEGLHHPDKWATAIGKKKAADELETQTAPHRWEPLYSAAPGDKK